MNKSEWLGVELTLPGKCDSTARNASRNLRYMIVLSLVSNDGETAMVQIPCPSQSAKARFTTCSNQLIIIGIIAQRLVIEVNPPVAIGDFANALFAAHAFGQR